VSPHREDEAGGATHQAERDAFRKQLSNDAPPSCAKRDPDAEFAGSGRRSRQHQIRKVEAGDQQHARDRSEQDEERRLRVGDERVV